MIHLLTARKTTSIICFQFFKSKCRNYENAHFSNEFPIERSFEGFSFKLIRSGKARESYKKSLTREKRNALALILGILYDQGKRGKAFYLQIYGGGAFKNQLRNRIESALRGKRFWITQKHKFKRNLEM